MKRYTLAIVSATVVSFIWGFVFWGQVAPRTGVYDSPSAEQAQALKTAMSHLPSGTYIVPDYSVEDMDSAWQEGPRGLVYVSSGPASDSLPWTMVKGFFAAFISIAIIVVAVLFLIFEVSRLGTSVAIFAAGFGASLFQVLNHAVWWEAGTAFTIASIIYQLVNWWLIGWVAARVGYRIPR